jgi:hypothetical protein
MFFISNVDWMASLVLLYVLLLVGAAIRNMLSDDTVATVSAVVCQQPVQSYIADVARMILLAQHTIYSYASPTHNHCLC